METLTARIEFGQVNEEKHIILTEGTVMQDAFIFMHPSILENQVSITEESYIIARLRTRRNLNEILTMLLTVEVPDASQLKENMDDLTWDERYETKLCSLEPILCENGGLDVNLLETIVDQEGININIHISVFFFILEKS